MISLSKESHLQESNQAKILILSPTDAVNNGNEDSVVIDERLELETRDASQQDHKMHSIVNETHDSRLIQQSLHHTLTSI